MEKQYSGSCNDAIITAYVPVYSAALLSLLPTLSGRKQLFVYARHEHCLTGASPE